MHPLAIIGGSGLDQMDSLRVHRREIVHTPYGEPSAPLAFGQLDGASVVFLPRHGSDHRIAPHRINYRANLWALHHVGCERVVGVAAVGGISEAMGPGVLAVPDQLIDYTWGREHSLFDCETTGVTHVEFTAPYCQGLREHLLNAASRTGAQLGDGGTYAATQGPRLETAAEIDRLERDGCDMVGMTGMPEAGLARELGLCYACLALSVNWAAGRSEAPISMSAISTHLVAGMGTVARLLAAVAY